MTLFMARFHEEQIENVIEEVNHVTHGFRQQRATHTGYFVTPGSYYEISYERTPGLIGLHETVISQVSRYRYSPGNPYREQYFGVYSQGQKANAAAWGYDLANALYRPHITLTRFSEVPDESTELPTAMDDLSFTITRIGLFKADNLGAARELIKAVDLRG